MRLPKKLLTILLAVILTVAFSVNGLAISFTDVADSSPYYKAISTMAALGLLVGDEDGAFRPNDTITRAEFAAVITRTLGMEDIAAGASSASIFTDMTTNGMDHWATGYVRVAYDRKIILGMGDGTFAPDSPVTYEQAVKMIVCALGREAGALEKGGWPSGYILEASDINITQNATMSPSSAPAPRGIVAQLVYNSLEVKLMERSMNGTVVQVDKTLLNDMLKITRFTNYMVTEVDGVVEGTSSIKDGELVLEYGTDSDVYVYNGVITSEEAMDMLGLYVSGYYKVDPDTEDNILLLIEATSTSNDELIIHSDDIESMRGSRLEYWEDRENDADTTLVSIAPDAKLIYNGSTYNYRNSSDLEERELSYWLDPSSEAFINGQVRLLDAGGDRVYDAVFIEDYETFVVKSAVKTTDTKYENNYVVYDKYVSGKRIQIDPYDRNNVVEIYNAKTGAEMRIEDVKAMNILSVANSKGTTPGEPGTHFICYVSTDAISGTIQAVSSEDKYIINNKEYELTREFEQVIADNKASMDLGSMGTFYLDKDGKIAAADITVADSGDDMYITRVGKYKNGSENAAAEVIALSGSPSTPEIIRIASEVRINGERYSNPEDIIEVLRRTASLLDSNQDGLNAQASQLAKISIGTGSDNEKEIKSIRTAATTNDGELAIGSNTDAGILKLGQAYKDYIYSQGHFESQILINSATQVIVVPTDRNDTKGYTRSKGTGAFETGYTYSIEAYDIVNNYAKVIVVYGGMADIEIKSNTPASLIKSVSRIMSSTGDGQVYQLEVYENGSIVSYETEDDSSDYGVLQPGDIVRFGFNGSGQINKVEEEVNVTNPQPDKTLLEKNENGEYKFASIFGTVCSLLDNIIRIAPAYVDASGEVPTLDTSEAILFTVPTSVPVYRVTVNGSGVNIEESIDINEVIEFGESTENPNPNATTVYAYAAAGELKMLVLYDIN